MGRPHPMERPQVRHPEFHLDRRQSDLPLPRDQVEHRPVRDPALGNDTRRTAPTTVTARNASRTAEGSGIWCLFVRVRSSDINHLREKRPKSRMERRSERSLLTGFGERNETGRHAASTAFPLIPNPTRVVRLRMEWGNGGQENLVCGARPKGRWLRADPPGRIVTSPHNRGRHQ